MTTTVTLLEDLRGLARQSHRHLSFSPEKRGDQIISNYSQELEEDMASMPGEEADQYMQKYIRLMRAWLVSLSGCASPMITGPSKFPVERMKKRSQWADNHYSKWREWRTKALKAIARKVKENRTPDEIENERWAQVANCIRNSADTIIRIDNGLEPGLTRALFVKAIVGTIEVNAKNGSTAIVRKALDLLHELNKIGPKPIVTDTHSVWTLDSKAEAAAEQKSEASAKENTEYILNDIRIVDNYQEDRVQMFFRDKAHAMTHHDQLKGSGWNWSHKNQAWQRKLTGNAQYSALKIAAGVPLSSYKSELNGKYILTAVVKTVEEANNFTARNPQFGVIGENDQGIHIARLTDTGT